MFDNGVLSKSTLAGQPVPANAVSAVKVSQGSPFSRNVRVQPARKGNSHLHYINGCHV